MDFLIYILIYIILKNLQSSKKCNLKFALKSNQKGMVIKFISIITMIEIIESFVAITNQHEHYLP